MNKKIKVIELLNKIYANLDVPEKVKYNDKKYEYSIATQDYKSEDGEWLFQRMLTFYRRWTERKVEILEDEEEIDIEDIKNEYNEHAKNIINDLIKDGYELEGIKERIEAMINYIESIKEK